MRRTRNVKTFKTTNMDSTNKATHMTDFNAVARMQEQVRLLQLKNDIPQQHMPNKSDHTNRHKSVCAKVQKVLYTNVERSICRCTVSNCSTRRCSCFKKDNKCNESCLCRSVNSNYICENQELRNQNEEREREDKTNIILNGMETPTKQEKVTRNKASMRTKCNNLARKKITNDMEEQFDPMNLRYQLSRPSLRINKIFVDEMNHFDNEHKSQLSVLSQIKVLPFNINVEDSLNIEKKVDWEQHRAQLIPCKKCNKTFMPHSIRKHEACCKKI